MPELNDAAVLDQLREHWQKMVALIAWKLKREGRPSINLTADDIASFPPDHVLLTHGHRDSFEFKIVSRAEAERIAAHDAKVNRGTA